MCRYLWGQTVAILAISLLSAGASAQIVPKPAGPPAEAQPPASQDSLGRTTPRGAVVGFLRSAQRKDFDAATAYLETRLTGKAAAELAQQLYVVLDRGLPTQLNALSDRPEGSLVNPLKPDLESLGIISSGGRTLEVSLKRVTVQEGVSYWLFSRETLNAVPALYSDLNAVNLEIVLPQYFVTTVLVGFPLYQWIGIFVGLPCAYLLFTLVSRILGVVLGSIRRYWSGNPGLANVDLFPVPIRLLAVALLIRFGLAHLELPLLARQFWSNVATVVTVGAVVWILLLVNGWAERRFRQRLRLQGRMGVLSVLRSASRLVALLIIIAGVAATLYHFGVSATTALAGFGVGGIALALAARTTLENILGGLSLISDNAIRIGDFLKVGDTLGTVENIGLRYTQIRTLDRSVVSIANGQMGSMTLENLSAREKFWFHPMLSLQYATTPASLRTIIDSIGNLLAQDNRVEPGSIRVRLLRFATFSLDVEIFAYVLARDWAEFLGVQEHLLLRVLEIVEEAGARIATPAQIVSRVYPAEAPRSPVTQLRAKS